MKIMITQLLYDALNQAIDFTTIESLLEKPKHEELGDIAFPCFMLAKILRQAPAQIAAELAEKLNISYKKLQKNQDKITYIQEWLKDNFEVK